METARIRSDPCSPRPDTSRDPGLRRVSDRGIRGGRLDRDGEMELRPAALRKRDRRRCGVVQCHIGHRRAGVGAKTQRIRDVRKEAGLCCDQCLGCRAGDRHTVGKRPRRARHKSEMKRIHHAADAVRAGCQGDRSSIDIYQQVAVNVELQSSLETVADGWLRAVIDAADVERIDCGGRADTDGIVWFA